MTVRQSAVVVLLVACLGMSSPRAQQAPPSAMPAGTGSISGHVTAGTSGAPIAGALVEVVIYENSSARLRQALTDAQGRFTLPDLPAGHFLIQASATGFIGMQYGQLTPGPAGSLNPSRLIELQDKQKLADADFALTRYSAIEGTVTDEMGDPVPNVRVQVLQLVYASGKRRLMPYNLARDAGGIQPTDDLGHFRIWGLPPGRYYLAALAGAFSDPSAAGGFAITYHPGVTDSAAATAFTVVAGQDVTNASFALTPSPTFDVGGTVVDAAGAPIPSSNLVLMPAERGPSVLFMMVRGVSGPDGRFIFRNVPPGRYSIQAFGKSVVAGAGNLASFTFGYLPVTTGEGDTAHLTLQIPEPRTLRGHISFEDPSAAPSKPGTIGFNAMPIEFESAPVSGGPAPTTVHDDWTFEVKAMSGQRVVSAVSPGWFTKRVTYNGQDVTDTALDFRQSDVDGVEIMLTQKASTTTITLATPPDRRPADYSVLVFSADDQRWGIWSRYVSLVRPNQQGAFVVRNLPAGQYLAAVVGPLQAGEWQDPGFLRALRDSGEGSPFSLSDAGTADVHLTVKK